MLLYSRMVSAGDAGEKAIARCLHHDTAMVFRFNVRFGAKADICSAKRFTPESDIGCLFSDEGPNMLQNYFNDTKSVSCPGGHWQLIGASRAPRRRGHMRALDLEGRKLQHGPAITA